MLRRLLRILVPCGLLLGLVMLARRTATLRGSVGSGVASPDPWTPIRVPDPPPPAWVAANEDGSCPPTHPIKAKAASGIYHLPGMLAYARTKPDRCYAEEHVAVTDGFTKAKR
jgi:hypothetical protein